MKGFHQYLFLLLFFCCAQEVWAQEASEEAVYDAFKERLHHFDLYDSVATSRLHHEIFAYDSAIDNMRMLSSHMADYAKIHIAVRQNPDTAWLYINLAEQVAEQYQQKHALSKAQIFKAYYYGVQYERDKSLEYINRAKANFSPPPPDLNRVLDEINFHMMVADIYKVFNMFDSAMNHYQTVLAEAERMKRPEVQQKAKLRIAALLQIVGDVEKSREIYNAILYETPQADSAAVSVAARQLAGLLVQEGQLDSAKTLLHFAFQINQNTHKNSIFILTSLADIYSTEDKGDSALYYLNLLDIDKQTDLGRLLLDLGYTDAYLAKSNLLLAEEYHFSATQRINKKLESNWVRKMLRQKMQISEAKGDFQTAFQSLQNLKSWEDSLLNYQQQQAFFRMERQFQYEADIRNLQKEKELQQLELRQRNLLLIAIVLVFISLLLISYLIYNRKMHRRDKEANELNQQLLRIQLNPHFIFNALSSIQSFIMTNNNRAASISLAKFGELTRDILDTSREAYITLDKELKMLRNYVDIQKTRFEGELTFETEIAEEIDEAVLMVPPMFIQPFIENSLEHGLDRIKGGQIKLRLSKKGDEISVEISDNGRGLMQSKKSEKHTSKAIAIIQERLERIKGKHQQWLTIENIVSKQQVKGVSVKFTLPLMTT